MKVQDLGDPAPSSFFWMVQESRCNHSGSVTSLRNSSTVELGSLSSVSAICCSDGPASERLNLVMLFVLTKLWMFVKLKPGFGQIVIQGVCSADSSSVEMIVVIGSCVYFSKKLAV